MSEKGGGRRDEGKQVLFNFLCPCQRQSISGLVYEKANQNQQMHHMEKRTAPYCARVNIPAQFNNAPYANASGRKVDCKLVASAPETRLGFD